MSSYQFNIRKFLSVLLIYLCGISPTFCTTGIGVWYEGSAQLIGSVIATPCSIMMKDHFQTIDFSSLALASLSMDASRESHTKPFNIELRNCGSMFSSLDSKTWTIRFDGNRANHIDAFVLHGPSKGIGVSVLNSSMQTLVPGRKYPLFGSLIRLNKSNQTLLLRYFLRLELTGEPIQPGRYQGLIRFFIDYQ